MLGIGVRIEPSHLSKHHAHIARLSERRAKVHDRTRAVPPDPSQFNDLFLGGVQALGNRQGTLFQSCGVHQAFPLVMAEGSATVCTLSAFTTSERP
ncbi:hypothetical protein D3C78_1779470 [compost metagenome]